MDSIFIEKNYYVGPDHGKKRLVNCYFPYAKKAFDNTIKAWNEIVKVGMA